MDTGLVRNEKGLFTHPLNELNRKEMQKFLPMGESKNSKATVPLEAVKNLSGLRPHHNRAILYSAQPCLRPPPLASPSFCQPPAEPSRLTRPMQAVEVTKAKAPSDWLL